jgi:2-polyprenyl-3-methyl-5-hydroxy-6-metoxy-1,4-benzoquinol methylase
MQVLSPITKSKNVKKITDYSCKKIITTYQKDFNFDVSDYFKNQTSIERYQCLDTGYNFYYPLNLSGDELFYQKLQKFSWYYSDWKWEYEDALLMLSKGKRLLEVGCGMGYFLKRAMMIGTSVDGLELNNSAVEACKGKGLKVHQESVADYALKHRDCYDYVFSFQVLEHIAEAGDFIKSMIDLLKPGGVLLISVPNNESALFKESDYIALNMPPHHMGLWDANSLISLGKYFPIRIEKLWLENLGTRHQGVATAVAEKFLKKTLNDKFAISNPLLVKLIKKIIFKSVELGSNSVTSYMAGHTITAVYTKYE